MALWSIIKFPHFWMFLWEPSTKGISVMGNDEFSGVVSHNIIMLTRNDTHDFDLNLFSVAVSLYYIIKL